MFSEKTAKKPNIFLITFDDCRADHLGFMGYKKNTSPFLDSLSKRGTYFKKAFATGSGSPQSFVGSMTSTYPLDYGGFGFIDKPRVLISEVLQKAGYETIAIHSAAYLSGYFGYDRGWDIFHYINPQNSSSVSAGNIKGTFQSKILGKISGIKTWLKKNIPFLAPLFSAAESILFLGRKLIKEAVNYIPPFLTGDEINEKVKQTLLQRNKDKPLFLWVHYMDVHEPTGYCWRNGHGLIRKSKFHIADIIQFLFRGKTWVDRLFKNLYIQLYDASIGFADKSIGDLFEYLDNEKLLGAEDLAVVFSDHGSEFFEKGEFGHGQRPFNANLNIPLIFYSPKKIPIAIEGKPVSLIDVPPTILDFVGIPKPEIYKGKNIFDGKSSEVVAQMIDCRGDLTEQKFAGAIIVDNGYKFIFFHGKKMLFSLEDNNELRDLYNLKKEIADSLERKLEKYISKTEKASGV